MQKRVVLIAAAWVAINACSSRSSVDASTIDTIVPDGNDVQSPDSSIADSSRARDGSGDALSDHGPLMIPDGGPITEHANCSALPAVGTWEDITPAAFRVQPSTETFAVAVDPYTQTVYSASCNNTARTGAEPQYASGLHRSTDCGATWQLVNTGASADLLRGGCAWSIHLATAAGSEPVIYLNNGYGPDLTIFRSRNGGVDFEPLNPDPENATGPAGTAAGVFPFVHAIALSKFDPRQIAVGFHNQCNLRGVARTPVCFSRSLDGGDTWQMFNGPPSISGWEEGESLTILGPTSYLISGASGSWMTANEGADWTNLSSIQSYCCYSGTPWIEDANTVFASFNDYAGGIFVSRGQPLGGNFVRIDGTPRPNNAIISDGVNLFAGRDTNTSSPDRQYFRTTLADPFVWTLMDFEVRRGPNQMAYDSVHHVIYSANFGSGLLRFVSR